MVVVLLPWGTYRIPGDFELGRRKDDPRYRAETRWFRWLLVRVRRPSWAEMVVVIAAAACASQANLQLSQRRGDCFGMAWARTWGFENGQALKDLLTPLPQQHYRRCWSPLDEPGRRRTYWTSTKRACLRHIGDVTIGLRKPRRNDGPKPTKILVTHLPAVTARHVVDVDRRRWAVARLIKALKGAMGWGHHQVTKDPPRVERSVAMSVMASLMIVKVQAQDIPEHGAWSMLTLKQNFTWQLARGHREHAAEQRLRKELWERKAA
jgi:hypothetical protein